MAIADSILPVNLDAERSILGAILLDNVCYVQAAAMLKPDDFSLDSHRRIYNQMRVLGDSNRPIDFVTLFRNRMEQLAKEQSQAGSA